MTPNHTPTPCPTTRARVARTRSEVIPAGDALPSTHTPPTAAPGRMVTVTRSGPGPLPFTAPHLPAIPAVAAMSAVVTVAAANAVLTVLAGHPDRWWIVAAVLVCEAAWTMTLLATGTLLRHRHQHATAEPANRTPQARRTGTVEPGQAKTGRDDQQTLPTATPADTTGERDAVEAWPVSLGRRPEPRRAEAGGRSPKRRPQAVGAAEGGGEDRRPLGNGETSSTTHPGVTPWR
jgi:hypothetical protein